MSWLGEKIQSILARVEYKARCIYIASNDCCQIEIENLISSSYDIDRLGYRIVSRPEEASLMLVSGWLNKDFIQSIQEDYACLQQDKAVIAVGSTIVSGAPYIETENSKVIADVIPVDLYLPGNPPRPEALIQALLQLETMKLGNWKNKDSWIYEVMKSNG